MDFSPRAFYSTAEDLCCEITFSSPAIGKGVQTRGACNLTASAVITLSLKTLMNLGWIVHYFTMDFAAQTGCFKYGRVRSCTFTQILAHAANNMEPKISDGQNVLAPTL